MSAPDLRHGEMPELFTRVPEPFASDLDPTAPWGILGETLDRILADLPARELLSPIPPGVHLLGDGFHLGEEVVIYPGAVLEAPVWIGRGVTIRPGVYVRGGAWIGDGCLLGANTEVKRGILFPGAHAPHLNYVGDSILGSGVNLGAGTILSNFRHDGREVMIPVGLGRLATGRRKLGAILGEGVKTGCNCVVHPGAVVGRGTQIYPGVQLRSGIYPVHRVIKLRQQVQTVALSQAGT